MKKLILLLALVLFSCSADETTPPVEATCYDIMARGTDERGDYIIIKYQEWTNKRYSVTDYHDYIGQAKLCEPITLTEQPL